MTTTNLAAVTNALEKRFERDLISNINRSSPILQVLRLERMAGQNIQWSNTFGTATTDEAEATAEGADVSVFTTDTKAPAVLQAAVYTEAFEVTGVALAGAAAAGNPDELADLFRFEIDTAGMRLSLGLAKEVYRGTGTAGTGGGTRMIGFDGGAILDTGTYAGLDRATYPQWASTIVGNGGIARDVSVKLMHKMQRKVQNASGMTPNLIVGGTATVEQYGLLFGDQRRYNDEINVPGAGPMRLDGGFRTLEFNGIPVMPDLNAPEGKLYFLNTGVVLLRQLPQPGQRALPLVVGELELMGQNLNAPRVKTPIRVRIQALGPKGDKFQFQLVAYIQLQVRQPNACGVLTDLAYDAT